MHWGLGEYCLKHLAQVLNYYDELTGPRATRAVLQNMADEPIPGAVKRRLLEPMIPRPVPPKRMHRGANRRAILAELDPLLTK